MKNFTKADRVDSESSKLWGPIWDKILRKNKLFKNIHYCHSSLMMVPFNHSKNRKNP